MSISPVEKEGAGRPETSLSTIQKFFKYTKETPAGRQSRPDLMILATLKEVATALENGLTLEELGAFIESLEE